MRKVRKKGQQSSRRWKLNTQVITDLLEQRRPKLSKSEAEKGQADSHHRPFKRLRVGGSTMDSPQGTESPPDPLLLSLLHVDRASLTWAGKERLFCREIEKTVLGN